ncbi:MAG: flavodoxin family protein [Bacteroidales bacterium]|jgi:multimeric flavodoxin WrbA|nr:flavodoxin family protein [Bacteroidales bacterium]
MKVTAINGSPHAKGNTWFALKTAGDVLVREGVDFQIIHVGNKNVHGCISCRQCAKNQDDKCSIRHDELNNFLPLVKDADGIILGAPVYYSGIAGIMKCFLDRLFYVSGANGNWMRHKVGAAVTAVRRSGGSSTLDSLYHYLTISEMIVATSNYWGIIHGQKEEEAAQDAEGIQTMQVLGANMAWLLALKQAAAHIAPPPKATKIATNFIR